MKKTDMDKANINKLTIRNMWKKAATLLPRTQSAALFPDAGN